LLTQDVLAPTQVDEDLAYFLGCLFGNGHISQSPKRVRFSFGATMTSTVGKLQSIGQRLFGFGGVITDENTKLELCFASGQLVDWLVNNNLSKNEKSAKLDRIPLAIRQSSLETILGFFCGLIDTDDCVRSKGSLSIDSASELFLRNLQQIGEAVGLSFSIFHNTKGENLQGQKDMWGLCLSRMLSTAYALNYLNTNSIKCQNRNIPKSKRVFKFDPYKVVNIEFETTPDYSFDISVEGVDDNDSWYWQGALKSHNSKSLLTGASCGWHPPKAAVYIRRMTFDRDNPIALACMDYGYNVIPGQSDKDENGNLLTDPHDPRCTEWLVEMPFKCGWADIPGCSEIDISKFSVAAQYDFYMQVQRYYAGHNVSATLELREAEIPILSKLIHNTIQNDEGYISAALLARFDSLETFPRMPFEPITLETYNKLFQDVLNRRKSDDFVALLAQYDQKAVEAFNQGAAGCDSDKCLMPEVKPTNTISNSPILSELSSMVADFLSDSKIITGRSKTDRIV
jgi:ribonucleotide reductase class II